MAQAATQLGTVAGFEREAGHAFFGIPYAATTAGENRFRAPQPAAPWSGVRDATVPGLAAPQSDHPIPGFAASGPTGEDCLSLNVFTPALDDARRPVLFWIHGGGFTHGMAAEPLYDGTPLSARGDVVVVTINYRLGALGYLDPAGHLAGRGLTANAGQLDQVAALEWVRDNAAAFGGDPGNVTIFGKSAGAAAVGTLMAMPAAKGLFHKAILQSGSGRGSAPESSRRVAAILLHEIGLGPEEAAKLLDLPTEAIIESQDLVVAKARAMGGIPFGPAIDGETLPSAPLEALQAGHASDVPMLIGTNRDEIKLFAAASAREPIDDDTLVTLVRASLGETGEEEALDLIDLYRESRASRGLPDANLDILDAVVSDVRFRIPSLRFAEAQAAHQPGTYVYLFTYESPARRGQFGSCHALEMPFVFGTLNAPTQDRFAGTGPGVEQLSANMMDAWLAFARTGKPGHAGIGEWAPYNATSRPTMVFDLESGSEDDPYGNERAAISPLVP